MMSKDMNIATLKCNACAYTGRYIQTNNTWGSWLGIRPYSFYF